MANWDTGRRVIVVDDNVDVADSFVMLLETLGVDARAAYGGPEALKLVVEFKPDLALIDVCLPKIDGCALVRHIRRLPDGSEVLLAALSELDRLEDRKWALEAGFDRCYGKLSDIAILKNFLLEARERLDEGRREVLHAKITSADPHDSERHEAMIRDDEGAYHCEQAHDSEALDKRLREKGIEQKSCYQDKCDRPRVAWQEWFNKTAQACAAASNARKL